MRTMKYAVETICQRISNADEYNAQKIHQVVSQLREFSLARVRYHQQQKENLKSSERARLAEQQASQPLHQFINDA